MNSFDPAPITIIDFSLNALSAEPYATMANGGPVLEHELPALLGLSLGEIRTLRDFKKFPKSKGSPCAPYWNRKKIVAYRFGLEQRPNLANVVTLILGYRKSNWAK